MQDEPASTPARAPVQASRLGPAGTISWAEHVRIWRAYAERYGNRQSALRIAERGGFGHGEIEMLTGGLAQTFVRNGAPSVSDPTSTVPSDG